MDQIEVKAKKWGNSVGIVLPNFIVKKEGINEGTELVINIQAKHKTKVGDLMEIGKKSGIAKKLEKIDTQQALKDIDKELWSE